MGVECNIGGVDPYRLGPLRDARGRDERVKRSDLAVAVADARETAGAVAAAVRRVAEARAAIVEGRRAYTALIAAGAAPGMLALADRYTDRRRRDLDAAIGEQLRAEAVHAGRLAAIDDARGRLAVARADRELIERHFARWREARKKLAERRED
jgi:hypothetical protein